MDVFCLLSIKFLSLEESVLHNLRSDINMTKRNIKTSKIGFETWYNQTTLWSNLPAELNDAASLICDTHNIICGKETLSRGHSMMCIFVETEKLIFWTKNLYQRWFAGLCWGNIFFIIFFSYSDSVLLIDLYNHKFCYCHH